MLTWIYRKDKEKTVLFQANKMMRHYSYYKQLIVYLSEKQSFIINLTNLRMEIREEAADNVLHPVVSLSKPLPFFLLVQFYLVSPSVC